MTDIPPISTSVQNALSNGFRRLDTAAAEIVSASQASTHPTPSDTADVRSALTGTSDPLLSGIRDLMLAKLQIGAGAALLHAYRANRQDLFEMLRP
jgi:hypothetical protein